MAHDVVEDGFLVLADISGFTAFVTGTEVEHGAWATGALLEVVMRELSPPLEIQELEGDAVFALGPESAVPEGHELPGVLQGAYAAFRDQQRQMALDMSCNCRACHGIARLDLKLVVHHGRFVRQIVGGRSRVTGPDVIVAHRLLKNPIGAGAYVLVTQPAVARAAIDPPAEGMRRVVLSYPYLGEIPCFVADLAPLRLEVAGAAAFAEG